MTIMWYVYLLECGDGSYYCGSTTDVTRRFQQHCNGVGAKYTRGRGPLRLLGSVGPIASQSKAQIIESKIKAIPHERKLQALFKSLN